MRTTLMFTVVMLAGAAQASDERRHPLYPADELRPTAAASEAVERVVASCGFSMMSRIGPSPGQREACDKAVSRAVGLGQPAAVAALARISQGPSSFASTNRLYDVVGRAGDTTLVEPLIAALERQAADEERGDSSRRYERNVIARTLTQLTYADPKGTPAIQWRAFWKEHHARSRAELLALRGAEARAALDGDDVVRAATAAAYLATQPASRAEGRARLQTLSRRPGLSLPEQRRIAALLADIPPDEAPLPTARQATLTNTR